DRQDFLNLASLPVRSRTILLANSIAVLMVAAVFAIDINAASAVLFPIIVTGAETSLPLGIRFSLTHFVCVLLAAGLAFSAVFAALGLLLAILPGRVFRFASIWARGAAITGLLALALTSGIAHLPPAVWFLGLSEVLLGRGDARSHALMNTGLLACAMSFIAAAVVYALCYRRSFLQAADIGTQLDTRPGGKWLSRLWARVPVGGSFERAGYSFMMRTLLRSDPHCLCVGAFAGMGLLFASQAALSSPLPAPGELPGAPWLSLPLIVSYMLLIGVRVAFEMPAGLQSNWIFQSVLAGTGHKAAAIARAGLLTCLAPLVLLPTFLGYSVFWGVMLASLHTAYVLTLSLGLIEVLLLRFRKIPFTCALPPFQNNLIMLCFLAAIGFTLFAGPAAQMAHWMLQNSVRFAILPVVVLALRLAGRYRPSELHPEASSLVFDPLPEPTVEHLRLLDR
ncbi:MAG TPA: hypothetical protein VEQ63_11225, partial [Bryobacteraceae bacterium]|nr:hypothetical protein [Bryobacteraceae bacterium]